MTRRLIGSMLLARGFAVHAQTARESTLDVVMKQSVLHACTPGDYKPLSFLKTATLTVHGKNLTIFDESLAKATTEYRRKAHKRLK